MSGGDALLLFEPAEHHLDIVAVFVLTCVKFDRLFTLP